MTKSSEYQFLKEWPEDSPIGWWNAGRKQLNIVIRAYNQWQLGGFDADGATKLRAQIIYGMQTFADRDGGGGWMEELEKMLQFVEENMDLS